MPSTSVKEPAVLVPTGVRKNDISINDNGLSLGRVDASALGAAIEHHRSESQRLAKAAEKHRAELRALLRQRDHHIVHLRASGWQLAPIASLYRVTLARIVQITQAIRATDGEVLAASCQGGES